VWRPCYCPGQLSQESTNEASLNEQPSRLGLHRVWPGTAFGMHAYFLGFGPQTYSQQRLVTHPAVSLLKTPLSKHVLVKSQCWFGPHSSLQTQMFSSGK
jgi:hypothetical protein